jgi:hypothetical protein
VGAARTLGCYRRAAIVFVFVIIIVVVVFIVRWLLAWGGHLGRGLARDPSFVILFLIVVRVPCRRTGDREPGLGFVRPAPAGVPTTTRRGTSRGGGSSGLFRLCLDADAAMCPVA